MRKSLSVLFLFFCLSIFAEDLSVVNVGTKFKISSMVRKVKEVDETISVWKGENFFLHFAVSAKVQEEVNVSVEGLSAFSYVVYDASYVKGDRNIKFADMLNPVDSLLVKPKILTSVWIKILVPANVEAKEYSAKVVFNGSAKIEKNINFKVVNRVLKPAKNRDFILDLWQNPDAIARWHKVKVYSDDFYTIAKPYLKMYADMGGDNITTAIIKDPWNSQTYDVYSSMIDWIKNEDGSFTYNFTKFDKWVQLAKDCGVNGTISCYTMIPWNNKFYYFDKATNKEALLETKPGTAEFKEHWTPFLRAFVSHLTEKKWINKTAISMDEREESLMLSLIQYMKEVAPELKITSAINYFSDLTADIAEVSPILNHADAMEQPWLDARKKSGKITTFYVCVGPRFPNTFIFSKPEESRWLGLYAKAKNLDGFLRWALNCWPANPIMDSTFGLWPAGDTYLIYPGPYSSVRLEKTLAGFDLYEKISVLQKELSAESLEDLNQFFAGVNHKRTNMAKVNKDLTFIDDFIMKHE